MEKLKLIQACELIMGQAPHSKSYNNEGLGKVFYRVSDFGEKFPISSTYTTNPLVFGKEGDIFLCIVGATCGKVNYGKNGAITRSIAALRPHKLLNQDFLYYFLTKIYNKLNRVSAGAAQPILNKTILSSIEIPIPALKEQKRIVKKIDESFEKIDKAIENTKKNIENVQEFYQSAIFYEFKVLNSDHIKWEKICEFIRGPFGGSLKKSMFVNFGYAIYEQKQAIHNDYESFRYFINEKKFNEMKRFEVEPGDLLMSCSGTLGRVSEVPKNAPKGIINQALLKLRTKKDKIYNNFLIYYIRSKIFQDMIFKYSEGAAQINVPSVKILKEIYIPCPALIEQEKILMKLDKLSDHTKKLESTYNQKLLDLEELKKSILDKAFKGEL